MGSAFLLFLLIAANIRKKVEGWKMEEVKWERDDDRRGMEEVKWKRVGKSEDRRLDWEIGNGWGV